MIDTLFSWLPTAFLVIVILIVILPIWNPFDIFEFKKQKTIAEYKKGERKYRKNTKENMKYYSAKWGYTFTEAET